MQINIKVPYIKENAYDKVSEKHFKNFCYSDKYKKLKSSCEHFNIPLVLALSFLLHKKNELYLISNYDKILNKNKRFLNSFQNELLKKATKDRDYISFNYYIGNIHLNNLITLSTENNYLNVLKLFLYFYYPNSYGDENLIRDLSDTDLLVGIKEDNIRRDMINFCGKNGTLHFVFKNI